MLHVCCVNNGNYLGRGVEYTNILHDMVRRNLPEGFEGDFTVFTDNPSETYAPGIIVRPLPFKAEGWWAKLGLFKEDVFPYGDRVLFFDLDTLICGPIDALATYDGNFAILEDFFRQGGLQSSVMAWKAGTQQSIFYDYLADGRPMNPGGDQWWIEQVKRWNKVDILQMKFPDMFESFKLLRGYPSQKASVIVFHGNPRPHEVSGWAAEVWKMGGMSRAELTAVCNTNTEKLAANVAHAVTLDCPWFDFDGDRVTADHCVIVGGGPSLASQIESIRWRQEAGQSIWATNNAAAYLHDHGIGIDAQVILDARPENAAFVHPAAGTYLIASQADPAVFERAYIGNTIIWHPHTEIVEKAVEKVTDKPVHLIGGGTTVGMLSMSLAFLLGYRRIHLYGFDSCYHGPHHHAYAQKLNDDERLLDVMFNDRKYVCAPWMAGQANEFIGLYEFMVAEGAIVTAHGDGLIPDICQSLLLNPTVTAADLRAHEVVTRLQETPEPKVAEIGVFAGDMSRRLLSLRDDMRLIMVDSWEGDGAAYADEHGDFHARLSDVQQEAYYDTAKRRVQFANGRAVIKRMRSVEAALDVDEVDLAFIDADHSYEGCSADIEAWWPKVRPGGWLGFHDYDNTGYPQWGVKRAVDEFATVRGLTVETGVNFTAFIRKPEA